MNTKHAKQSEAMKEAILAKIEAGEVTMKSKFHFALKLTVLIVVIIATCITASFLVSYIFFSLRISGRFALLGFGARGIRNFLDLFPWHLFFLELGLILILGLILKHFRFGYRNPAIYVGLGVLGVSAIVGFGMNRLPIHDRLLQQYEQGRFPGGAQLYERIRIPPERPGIFQGIIITINDEDFTILSPKGPQNVEVPHNVNPEQFLKIGDQVFVAGEIINGSIRAYGIRKVN